MSQWHTSEENLAMGIFACILSKRDAFWMQGSKQQETTKSSKHKVWKRLSWSVSLTLENCVVLDAWKTYTCFTCESFIWMPATQTLLMAKEHLLCPFSLLCTQRWGSRTRRLVGRRRKEIACPQSNVLEPLLNWGQESERGFRSERHQNFQLDRTRWDYKNNKATGKLRNLTKINKVRKNRDSMKECSNWRKRKPLHGTENWPVKHNLERNYSHTLCVATWAWRIIRTKPSITFSDCGKNKFILINKNCCVSSWQLVGFLRRVRFS